MVPADDEAGRAVGPGGASQQPRAEGQPSVLVIGWFRCKARHLRKYGELYADPAIGYHPLLFDRHAKVTPLRAGALGGDPRSVMALETMGTDATVVQEAMGLLAQRAEQPAVGHFAAQIILRHARTGDGADLGIGNSEGSTRDWTFTKNAGDYSSKRLRVYVRPTVRSQ